MKMDHFFLYIFINFHILKLFEGKARLRKMLIKMFLTLASLMLQRKPCILETNIRLNNIIPRLVFNLLGTSTCQSKLVCRFLA